jgi:DNA replication protein DnaC
MSNRLYDASGVPLRHKDFDPSVDNQVPEWKSLYEKLKLKINSGALIGLVGNRGTGKTQLGVSLIGYATYVLGKEALYRKSLEVFLRIREGMKSTTESERTAVDEFVKPFLLVIDAFEVRGDTEFEDRLLNHIIDKRYDLMKSTVIISNDTRDVLQKQLGPSICDRMNENGGICEMVWRSFRKSPELRRVAVLPSEKSSNISNVDDEEESVYPIDSKTAKMIAEIGSFPKK